MQRRCVEHANHLFNEAARHRVRVGDGGRCGRKAADTGTISGAVFDRAGQPVADATVKISGAQYPIGRDVATGANGIYQFEYLLPGEYTVEVDKAGIGAARRAAIVGVGRDTRVDSVIGLAVTEALTVTAATPIVDVRSTEVSFNFNADTLNSLPLERTYRGLFQLIPGVADNRSTRRSRRRRHAGRTTRI